MNSQKLVNGSHLTNYLQILRKLNSWFFHTPQRRVNYPVLKLNNVNIERAFQFNFLGVVINSTLKWEKHIAHISLKISRATGVIFRLRHYLPS